MAAVEIILLERVEKLGQMGDVVKVKPGYARNFLLPQKKALRANKANMAYFESQRAELEAINLKRRQEAEAAGAKINGLRLVMVRAAGESGQLYGSVAARDIQDALKDQGIKAERRQIEMDQVIKSLGSYELRIRLHPEVAVSITAVVARSAEEAEHAAQPVEEEADDVYEDDVAEDLAEDDAE